MSNEHTIAVVEYRMATGLTLRVRMRGDDVWLTVEQIGELYNRERTVIAKHIKFIFKAGELVEDSVRAFFAQVGPNGKTYQVAHYNLDMIIAVGMRVKSPEGTAFRKWANVVLRERMTGKPTAPVLDDATLDVLVERLGTHIVKRVDARIEERLAGQQLKFSIAADHIASYTPVHGVISTRSYNELRSLVARLAEIEGEIAFLSGKQPNKERAMRSARSRIIGAIKRIAHYGYAPDERLINMKAVHETDVFGMLRDREFRGLERLEQLKLARQQKIDFNKATNN